MLFALGCRCRYGFCSDGADCRDLLAAGFVNFIQFGPIAGGERLVQPGPLSLFNLSFSCRSVSLPVSASLHRQSELLLTDSTLPFALLVMNFLPECRSFTTESASFLPSQRLLCVFLLLFWGSMHSFGPENRLGFQKRGEEPGMISWQDLAVC